MKEEEEKLALLLRIRDATPKWKDIFCDQDQELQNLLNELELDDIETAQIELDSLLKKRLKLDKTNRLEQVDLRISKIKQVLQLSVLEKTKEQSF